MKTFSCTCGNRIFFHNSKCQRCGRILGFLPDLLEMSALEPAGGETLHATFPGAGGRLYRQCNNYRFQEVCNWLLPPDDGQAFCRACRLNQIIPDLGVEENRLRWYHIEEAKRRMLFTLFRLRLPLVGRSEDPKTGLSFSFLADPAAGPRVYTGHDGGLITINVEEADPGTRENTRLQMGERYRTLLGHFRHEIGHFYWDRLIADSGWLGEFRTLFGDERQDYGEALKRHYDKGPPPLWQEHCVTTYATMHPWEDWAESWAHYLHINDTLETAHYFSLCVESRRAALPPLLREKRSRVAASRSTFNRLITDWTRMSLAINAINRSMGMPDPYPFVLGKTITDKLYFVHRVVLRAAKD